MSEQEPRPSRHSASRNSSGHKVAPLLRVPCSGRRMAATGIHITCRSLLKSLRCCRSQLHVQGRGQRGDEGVREVFLLAARTAARVCQPRGWAPHQRSCRQVCASVCSLEGVSTKQDGQREQAAHPCLAATAATSMPSAD